MEFPQLPPVDKAHPNERQGADPYGATRVAAAYCGYQGQPHINAVWQHGCLPPWMDDGPYSFPTDHVSIKSRWFPVFVARQAEALLLANAGYRRVKAISSPFLYLPDVGVERRPGSLLVVPVHSLVGVGFAELAAMDAYADYIASIRKSFSTVVASVHSGCLSNGYWTRQFDERGIAWVMGANAADYNALLRMKMLFSQFEYVTTNGFGSHVAYALISGAKLSFGGPVPGHTKEQYLQAGGVARDLSCANYYLSPLYFQQQADFFAPFRRHPSEGVADIALGESLLGHDVKQTPQQLMDTFRWTTKGKIADIPIRVGLNLVQIRNRLGTLLRS